ncbi:hypothetical protein LCGC14_1130910 [marine sediment metagenome]|uniref:CopG-like ribbon-helix-helix domain-containing protein n=1 Tax=marine sediment metagenome TaxID=412755 RepID=A0A0F9M112_9ZZZZ
MKGNRSETVWVRVTPDLKAWIEGEAEKQGRTVSSLCAYILSEWETLSYRQEIEQLRKDDLAEHLST